MKVIAVDNGCSIVSWCPDIEEQALEQMEVIAKLPFVKYAALMPDAHLGMQMPIGGVVACENVVVPNFVGVDIGCGVAAIKTSIHKSEIEDEARRKKILSSFARGIPTGFNHNHSKRVHELKAHLKSKVDYLIQKSGIEYVDDNPIGSYQQAIYEQVGTLGGGNHFVEVQYDENGSVWIMLHSGSRQIGKRVGDYFNNIARELNEKWYSEGRDIPYLPADTPEGKAYLSWMDFSLRFAFMNRKVMLDAVVDAMEHEFPTIKFITKDVVDDTVEGIINIHHNFASLENHMGNNYWVHRKGATRAFEGMAGIIPGSMGTNSYIVKGLGNKLSLMSCSHGAGRKMGRREFCRKMKYSYDQIEESLKDVVHSDFAEFDKGKDKGMKDVSESPGAYKDIEDVINNERDLIDPIVKLRPLVCLKG